MKAFIINKTIKLYFLILTLTILGCSNNQVGIQYYSLNSIEQQTKKVATLTNSQQGTFVVIEKINLANFLNTGGLVMQINTHQIQISNQHLWGDKLPNAITTHLIKSLSSRNNNLYVEQKNSKNDSLADKKIAFTFDQFTLTNTSETVVSGYYTIYSTLHNNTQKTFFDIRQPLTEDGYNHAVNTFKKSLNELSEQVQRDTFLN